MRSVRITCDFPGCTWSGPEQPQTRLEDRDYVNVQDAYLCKPCAGACTVMQLIEEVLLPRSIDQKVKGNQ